MDTERETIISKTMARILRHNPGANGGLPIGLDGFVDLAIFVPYLNTLKPFLAAPLNLHEIVSVVGSDFKRRFEIANGRIRAFSGHSIPVRIDGEPFLPDGPLYFGTTSASRRVLEEGLTVSKKLKVRLSRTYEEALAVSAARPGDEPLVAEIDAPRLAADGWNFQLLSNGEVVTDPIPGRYLSVASAVHAAPPGSRAPRP